MCRAAAPKAQQCLEKEKTEDEAGKSSTTYKRDAHQE